MGDETLAINYLRYWYNASNVSALVSLSYISYSNFIAKERAEHPTFLTQLSASLKSIRQDKVKRAFEALAAQNPDVIPDVTDFFQSLSDELTAINPANVADWVGGGVADTAKQVGTIAAFGLGTYALIAGGIFLFFLIPYIKTGAKGAGKLL